MSQVHVNTVSKICSDNGVEYVVISPGSRSAPLTLAFARNPSIKSLVVPDERSAAFIGLGIAQNTKKPVALICTSGTAGLNYGPAIAEAYYQHIPLLVLTADRPPELIDQKDGQTIRQVGMFTNHVKDSCIAPVEVEDNPQELYSMVQKAIHLCGEDEMGPVHINYPFREPFYPESANFEVEEYRSLPIQDDKTNDADLANLVSKMSNFSKVLILSGQNEPEPETKSILAEISKKHSIPVVGDILSNLSEEDNFILDPELILIKKDQVVREALNADLLITFGDSLISKNLKIYLRQHKPTEHWHLQSAGIVADTFQSLTGHIAIEPKEFFGVLAAADPVDGFEAQKRANYLQTWKVANEKAGRKRQEYLELVSFGELSTVGKILDAIPESSTLHMGNSMPVRLANLMGNRKPLLIRSNRGTSGIDGTNATAVGNAISGDSLVTLITGDIAFFYDRNAFWHHESLHNLRVIILNNKGGGIFGMIDGPTRQPELKEYFLTPHSLTAENTAQDYNLEYQQANDSTSLQKALGTFWDPSKNGKVLEVFTDKEENQRIYRELKIAFQTQS